MQSLRFFFQNTIEIVDVMKNVLFMHWADGMQIIVLLDPLAKELTLVLLFIVLLG